MIDVNRDRLLSLAVASSLVFKSPPMNSASSFTPRSPVRVHFHTVCLLIGLPIRPGIRRAAFARFISAMNTKRGRVVQRKAKASTADALKREFGIELTERQHGGATQGADADGLPVGQVAQRQAVASA